MKISKRQLKRIIKEERAKLSREMPTKRRLIRETSTKELAGDFVENDIIDFLIDTGIVRPPSSSTGAATFDEDMDRVYRDAAKFLETFAIPYLREMAGVIERA